MLESLCHRLHWRTTLIHVGNNLRIVPLEKKEKLLMNSFPVLFLWWKRCLSDSFTLSLCSSVSGIYKHGVSSRGTEKNTLEISGERSWNVHPYFLHFQDEDRTVKDLEVFCQMGHVCCWLCCPVLISFFLFPLKYFQCQICWWFADLLRLEHLGGLFLCSSSAGARMQCVHKCPVAAWASCAQCCSVAGSSSWSSVALTGKQKCGALGFQG